MSQVSCINQTEFKLDQTKSSPTQPSIKLWVILKVLRCPKVLRNSYTDLYLFTFSLIFIFVILAPQRPPRRGTPCCGWSRIVWTAAPDCSHSSTAAASLLPNLLSRSRLRYTETFTSSYIVLKVNTRNTETWGSSTGRKRQVIAAQYRLLRLPKRICILTEEAAGVLDGVAGEAAHVTEVELWPATGQLAQRLLHRIAVIEIVVKPVQSNNLVICKSTKRVDFKIIKLFEEAPKKCDWKKY